MLITKLKTKEKIYLYATWGIFFLACFYGKKDQELYNKMQQEESEIFDYIRKKGYNIHWNIPKQTYEVIREVRE